MVSGMFAKLTAATATVILLAGCATPTASATPTPTDYAGFVAEYRALFPESVTIGQTDQDIIDGVGEVCQQINERGIDAYKDYIISTTDGGDAQRRLIRLVEISAPVC